MFAYSIRTLGLALSLICGMTTGCISSVEDASDFGAADNVETAQEALVVLPATRCQVCQGTVQYGKGTFTVTIPSDYPVDNNSVRLVLLDSSGQVQAQMDLVELIMSTPEGPSGVDCTPMGGGLWDIPMDNPETMVARLEFSSQGARFYFELEIER